MFSLRHILARHVKRVDRDLFDFGLPTQFLVCCIDWLNSRLMTVIEFADRPAGLQSSD